MNNKNKKSQAGYTMVELLLAVFCGSIVLAGTYASYTVVAAQYQKNSGISEIRDFAIPTINIISRDLRMAGYRAVDNNIESTYGRIDIPVSITNVSNACCDSIYVVYDKSLTDRYRITYFVAARTSPSRNALYMNIEKWNGTDWDMVTQNAIVADYVVDFQIEGSNNNSAGYPTMINFNIVFQSKYKSKNDNTFTKSAYGSGDYDNYTVTDKYLREEFDAAVELRNLKD